MDAVSGATERPCPHRIRVVTHGYEDIYGRSTPDAKIFQSGISPKVAKNHIFATSPDNLAKNRVKMAIESRRRHFYAFEFYKIWHYISK